MARWLEPDFFSVKLMQHRLYILNKYMNSSKDTQLIWEAYLNERQYPNRHKYHAIISELVDTLGYRFTIGLLNHADADMLMIEAADYTKREPGDTKTRDSRSNLIDTLVYLHNQIETENDPGKKAEMQNRFEMILKKGKRYGITQYDIERATSASTTGSSSYRDDWSKYESGSGTSSADATWDDMDDMDDWFKKYDQQKYASGAKQYGVSKDVYAEFHDITSIYGDLNPKPKKSTGGSVSSVFSDMDRHFNTMYFSRWVDEYKKAAEKWLEANKPTDPSIVTRHILTGQEIVDVWDWYVNGDDEFNSADEEHRDRLPKPGVQTADWKSKTDAEPEPEPSPEPEPESDTSSNEGSKMSSILKDIHHMLKRGKTAGGRIQNFLPLAGDYDPTTPEGQQVADDTETLLDLIDLLRQLNKASKQT